MKWKLSLFAVLVLVKFSVCFLFVFNMCFSSIIRHVHEGSLSAPNDTGTRKNSFNIEGSHSPNTKKPRQAWPKQKVTILTYLIRVFKKKLSPSCLHLTLFVHNLSTRLISSWIISHFTVLFVKSKWEPGSTWQKIHWR